jgi:hypothetical protein
MKRGLPSTATNQKELLSQALASCISGDIYTLDKMVKRGFDPASKDHLCIVDATRLGHTHIVSYLLKQQRPPNSVIKKISTIAADGFKNTALKTIIRQTGVYSHKTLEVAQYAGNVDASDYISERELFMKIGKFYNDYKDLPQRIEKLIKSDKIKFKDGEPSPIGFASQDQEVIRTLRGIVYKKELYPLMQISCRESLKDAASLFYLATKLALKEKSGYQLKEIIKDEGKNLILAYYASFGTPKDLEILQTQGHYLGHKNQINNLGYTICLAIKNNNYPCANFLIKAGYCPSPTLNVAEDPEIFDLIIKTLINSDDDIKATEVLNTTLNTTPKSAPHSTKEVLTTREYLKSPRMQQPTSALLLKAVKTGKHYLSKKLLEVVDLKKFRNTNYYNLNPEPYVCKWLDTQHKVQMLQDKAFHSQNLEI